LSDDFDRILNVFNASGFKTKKMKQSRLTNTLFAAISTILKKLELTAIEKQAIISFLQRISNITGNERAKTGTTKKNEIRTWKINVT